MRAKFINFKEYKKLKYVFVFGSHLYLYANCKRKDIFKVFKKSEVDFFNELRKFALPYTNMIGSIYADGTIKLFSTEELCKNVFPERDNISRMLNKMCDIGLLARIEVGGSYYFMLSPLIYSTDNTVDMLAYYIFNQSTLTRRVNVIRKQLRDSKYISYWKELCENARKELRHVTYHLQRSRRNRR